MEVNYKKKKFAPVSENLIRQVEKYSDLCDMTVRHGQWEKKFHRCVLSASPFFKSIIRAKLNFIEGATGVVDLKMETTPEDVEMALLFLYGRNPDLTFDNIEGMLELAEFFMIKNLKSYCIFWLQNQTLTNDNCISVLQLSTKYNFKLNNLDCYIESNLHEVFRNKDATSISRESLEYFFSDKKFTYVSMDEKLVFLAAWVTHNHSESEETIISLFNKIDKDELSYETVQHVKTMSAFNTIIDLEAVNIIETNATNRQDVLILFDRETLHFTCFNFYKDRWYWLNNRPGDLRNAYSFRRNAGITGIRSSIPEIYSFYDDYRYLQPTVTSINLETDERNTYHLSINDDEILENELRNVRLRNNIVIGTVKKVRRCCIKVRSQSKKQTSTTLTQLQFLEQDTLTCIFDSDSEEHLRRTDKDDVITKTVNYTDFYIGHISTEGEPELSPIFSLRNIDITDACIGNNSTVALLTESGKSVVLFDLFAFQIEVVDITPDEDYKIDETDTGFVIYNNTRCSCISGASGQSLLKTYWLKEYDFEESKERDVQYHYSNGVWFSVLNKDDDVRIQFTTHETILKRQFRNIKWKSIYLPENVGDISEQLLNNRNIFVVSISSRKLRCPIACLHCTFTCDPFIYKYYYSSPESSDWESREFPMGDSVDSTDTSTL
ncbi:uncharacterized protein LOC132741904 [Ruditapes philippinarum]|uniref:uncharacterized protein LOC132741904 n=1 Tax=Ruditapes philippinarum TaxID=129788 RepID=UPI00295BA642|nr:uncharacterized protein LOC132741904 [Ruditapes philippinarum]